MCGGKSSDGSSPATTVQTQSTIFTDLFRPERIAPVRAFRPTPNIPQSPCQFSGGAFVVLKKVIPMSKIQSDLFSLDKKTGEKIGCDPREMSPAELIKAGHSPDSLTKIFRSKCMDCCVGQADEVRKCAFTSCDLWPYRMGTNPFDKRTLSEEQREAARQRMVEARARRGEPA